MKDFSNVSLASAAVGYPARICTITRTDGGVFRFAESDTSITVAGDTYSAVPGVNISAIKHTANGEVPSCQIVAVHASGALFDTNVIDAGLFDAAAVQIYLVNRANLTTKKLWFTGSISTITYNAVNQVVFDVKGPSASAKILMTQKRSPMCRTDLFSTLCGLNKISYAVSATVAAVTSNFAFTTTSSLGHADGYFNQGVLVTASGTALEIANWAASGPTITTYLPCNRLITAGDHITLYPGCDKTLTGGCASFSNQLNFQGEPHFLGTAAASQQV